MLQYHHLLAGVLLLPSKVPVGLTPKSLEVGVYNHFLLMHTFTVKHMFIAERVVTPKKHYQNIGCLQILRALSHDTASTLT